MNPDDLIKDTLNDDYKRGFKSGVKSTVISVIGLMIELAEDCKKNGNEQNAYFYYSAIPYIKALLKEFEL